MKSAFTLIELLVVMLIVGFAFMTFTPKIASNSFGVERRLEFFDKLISEHLTRAKELNSPVRIIGFKGSANMQTHDGKAVTIPETISIQEAKINGYETRSTEYAFLVYPDGIVDHFELLTDSGVIIESTPLLLSTSYSKKDKWGE